MVKYFTIYGERCSGTNFVERAIIKNFKIELTWKYDFKHFFGFYDFKEKEKYDDTLFIGIIRGPYEWMSSLYRTHHHIPYKNRKDWNSFVNNEFYSMDKGEEKMEDRNMFTKERYKNIFELRYMKNKFLIEDMKKKVNNYIFLRYEDFNDRYELSMNYIEKKFNLERLNKELIYINNYKGYGTIKYKKKKYFIPEEIVLIIQERLNKEQENSLGYML